MTWICPIHGEVEGIYDMSGPLSNNVPAVIQCEHLHNFAVIVVLGFESEEEDIELARQDKE